MEPVPDAVNAEGSCFWVLGLFVIMIIKHLSTVYTMVYKYACSGLQTEARFPLPLERMARVPRRSAASHPSGKKEQPRFPACASREMWPSVSPCPSLPAPEGIPRPLRSATAPSHSQAPARPREEVCYGRFCATWPFLELAQLAGHCPGTGWSSFLTAVSRYQVCEPGMGLGSTSLLPRGLLPLPPVPSFIWPELC